MIFISSFKFLNQIKIGYNLVNNHKNRLTKMLKNKKIKKLIKYNKINILDNIFQ